MADVVRVGQLLDEQLHFKQRIDPSICKTNAALERLISIDVLHVCKLQL